MQGCQISCGTVVFSQKSRNLSRSLLTNNNFYCEILQTRIALHLETQQQQKSSHYLGFIERNIKFEVPKFSKLQVYHFRSEVSKIKNYFKKENFYE